MKCKTCNLETTNPKFCSKSCAAQFNNVKYPKRKAKFNNCIHCNTITTNKRFCSNECQGMNRFKTETLPKFLIGELIHKNTIRKCLLETVKYQCAIESCGNVGNHVGKNLVLQIDHIDGNSDNNQPSNLRWLCPNCHSQTPTFGNKLSNGDVKNTKREQYRRNNYSKNRNK